MFSRNGKGTTTWEEPPAPIEAPLAVTPVAEETHRDPIRQFPDAGAIGYAARIIPATSLFVPCPYCYEPSGAHLGSCQLSIPRGGKLYITVAIAVECSINE